MKIKKIKDIVELNEVEVQGCKDDCVSYTDTAVTDPPNVVGGPAIQVCPCTDRVTTSPSYTPLF